jgi:hypothetical protein
VSSSSIKPDNVIPQAGRLDQVTTKEQRVMAMQRAEQHMELYPRDVSTIIIRELLLELALLDGAYELLASLHRTSS